MFHPQNIKRFTAFIFQKLDVFPMDLAIFLRFLIWDCYASEGRHLRNQEHTIISYCIEICNNQYLNIYKNIYCLAHVNSYKNLNLLREIFASLYMRN